MSDRREDGPEAAHLGAGRDRAGRGTTNSVTIGRDTGWGTRFLTTIHGTPYLPNPLAGAGSGSGLNTPQTSSLGGTGVLALILWECIHLHYGFRFLHLLFLNSIIMV